MHCKNCHEKLEAEALFCDHCGAKVITNRITFRFLIGELLAMLGFDSLFFRTFKTMFTRPHVLLKEYLMGVRKRYVNPFGYLALGAALTLLMFNLFADEYQTIQKSLISEQVMELEKQATEDLSALNLSEKEYKKRLRQQNSAKAQIKFQNAWWQFFLKYYNIMTFLFLPFYALISWLTYRKPYNFGEHLVINAYMQGTVMYFTILTFFLGYFISPNIYAYSLLMTVVYYLYTFTKLLKHSWKQTLGKLLRFVVVLIICCILAALFIFIIALIVTLIVQLISPDLIKNTFGLS